jgi:hypothetical protein
MKVKSKKLKLRKLNLLFMKVVVKLRLGVRALT